MEETATYVEPANSLLVDGLLVVVVYATPVVIVLVIVGVLHAIARRGIAAVCKRQQVSAGVAAIFQKLVFWVAVLAAIFFSLQALGILAGAWASLTAILAMIAIGFVAVWSVLSNILCSFILMIARPFMIGDTIEVMGDGWKGRVVDFSLLYTTLEPQQGGLVQVPNNLLFQRAIHRLPGEVRVELDQHLESQSGPGGEGASSKG
ncbi:mechanosensitive ion channel domain-containing protein [Mucisphaera sp.]|uniref:mechanosensitive ion channel domain-containing protein n=1 Tax=Mucisphaera sp. TaxID=2913024 RepID=UPI003D0FFA79